MQHITFGTGQDYWEAWTVTNGQVDQVDMNGGNDVFAGPSAAYSPVIGQLQFYPNSSMASFPELDAPGTPGWAYPSQSLYSTYTQPGSWTSTGALPHQIVVTPTQGGGFTITGTP